MFKEDVAEKIIETSEHFSGLFEVAKNARWSDAERSAELEKLMKEAGWQLGWPYCMSFVEAVWVKTYRDLKAPNDLLNFVRKSLNPSVINSYSTFKSHWLIKKHPSPGSIMFLQKGFGGTGHAGIVESWTAGDPTFKTIEGNTNPAPGSAEADREGDGIFRKSRKLDYLTSEKKLNLLGFLEPIEW